MKKTWKATGVFLCDDDYHDYTLSMEIKKDEDAKVVRRRLLRKRLRWLRLIGIPKRDLKKYSGKLVAIVVNYSAFGAILRPHHYR